MSNATPFTSAGEVKRSSDLLTPNDPVRANSQCFTLTLLAEPNISSVPSYCRDLDCARFWDSATIWRASCAWAGRRLKKARSRPIANRPQVSNLPHQNQLFILQRLNQRSTHCRFSRSNRRQERPQKNHRQQHQRNLKRVIVVEPQPAHILADNPQAVVKLQSAQRQAKNHSHQSDGQSLQPNRM